MEKAPFPGPLGEEIARNVSDEVFEQWRKLQNKLINECHLDLSQAKDRKELIKHMRGFCNLDKEKEPAAQS